MTTSNASTRYVTALRAMLGLSITAAVSACATPPGGGNACAHEGLQTNSAPSCSAQQPVAGTSCDPGAGSCIYCVAAMPCPVYCNCVLNTATADGGGDDAGDAATAGGSVWQCNQACATGPLLPPEGVV